MREPDPTPMVWTTKGNMPVEFLDYNVEWFENPDEIGLVEVYRHQGEIVRRSVHVRKKEGLSMDGDQAAFA